MSGVKISDLPASYQDQVRRQLAQSSSPTAMMNLVQAANCSKPHPPATPADKPRNRVTAGAKRTMNANEQGYNKMFLGGNGKFEAVTLKLPGGSRYTPDFATWDSAGRMTCHEVKGSYKLQSKGRAATAFRECVAAFPDIVFVWATQDNGAYNVQTFNERTTE